MKSYKQHTHTSHHHHNRPARTHSSLLRTNLSTRPKRRAAPSAKALELARHEHNKGKAAGRGRKPGWGCWLLRGCRSQQHAPVTHGQVGEARGKKRAGTAEATTTDDVEEVAAPPAKGREEEEHAVASW